MVENLQTIMFRSFLNDLTSLSSFPVHTLITGIKGEPSFLVVNTFNEKHSFFVYEVQEEPILYFSQNKTRDP